jgi:hypothetical protein
MQKILFVALIAAAMTSATHSSERPWTKEPASVFGIRFGQPIENRDVADCDGPYRPDTESYPFCRHGAFRKATLLGKFTIPAIKEGMLTFEDELPASLMVSADHDDYADLRSILIERYGEPTKRVLEQVKTKAGAAFRSETLTWIGKNISITLKEYSGTINQSAAFFTSTKGAVRMNQRRQEQLKQDAS